MRIPRMYLYMMPFFFGAPVLMYYTVDHKPREDVEADLQTKYASLINEKKKERREGFKKVWEGQKDQTLDKLLRRGRDFNHAKRVEFDGPRSEDKKE
jgi:hypothetical protein